MLISMAYAQEVATDAIGEAAVAVEEAPNAASAMAWNIGLIAILVVMFYVLLIRPQQKRFSEHKQMLDSLKKGDKVVTAGGLVGKIEKLSDDKEVIIDLGNNIKVTALRHTIQSQAEAATDTKK